MTTQPRRPTGVPPCYKVGCTENGRHTHVGAIVAGERIVVTPKLTTAPSWAYTEPHGRLVATDGVYATVELDDGTTRCVTAENVVRERLHKRRPLRRVIPRPLYAPDRKLTPGSCVEPPLFDVRP